MIGLIQRVSQASVAVEGGSIAEIGAGMLLLLGIEKNDTEKNADLLLDKIIHFRVFEDEQQKMNRSLLDCKGELLIVPQFTLPADTRKGTRPSFASAAPPQLGKKMVDYFIAQSQQKIDRVQTGNFGADMQVSLVNTGPVTFWLQK